ncbi:MAG TPA: GAF domain-containing protein [Flavobacterium sp.]|jgi:GAF domain-containing protein
MENNNETLRLEDLYKYEILDSPADGAYDELTSLAAEVFNVPVAIITLVDSDRIWFKSAHGLNIEQIDRGPGLCISAILSDELHIVEDARIDPRTLANPLVTGMLGLQFYAAAPLITKNGYRLGTFCIIDVNPRVISVKESSMLRRFSRIVMDHFELRLQSRLLVKDLQAKSQN